MMEYSAHKLAMEPPGNLPFEATFRLQVSMDYQAVYTGCFCTIDFVFIWSASNSYYRAEAKVLTSGITICIKIMVSVSLIIRVRYAVLE